MKRTAQTPQGDDCPPQKVPSRACSNVNHSAIPAKLYCSACSSFFCEECEGHHTFMHPEHASSICSDLSSTEHIFTGKCLNHPNEMLDYLCCTHNVLCCAKCKLSGGGIHTTCKVIQIEESMCNELSTVTDSLKKCISTVKVDKLDALKARQSDLEKRVDDAKQSVTKAIEKINEILSEREKELKDDLNKLLDDWGNVNLIMRINSLKEAENVLSNIKKVSMSGPPNKADVRNIVNCIYEAKKVIEELKKTEKSIDNVLETEGAVTFEWNKEIIKQLKSFGIVPRREEFLFKWKECPQNIDEKVKYIICKGSEAVKKVSTDSFCSTVIGDTSIPLNTVTSWSIKVLKSKKNGESGIYIGIAPNDINQSAINCNTCGWYFSCDDSTLCSGPPHSYSSKEYGPRKEKGEQYVHTGDSICVIMDTKKGELSYSLDEMNLGVAYKKIPLDKPLVPCVLLWYGGDSVELVTPRSMAPPPPSQRQYTTSDCLVQ